jgi:hypothetical protein
MQPKIASLTACAKVFCWGTIMKANWSKILGVTSLATVVCFGAAGSIQADDYHHHRHGCGPQVPSYYQSYRPIVVQPYYGNNFRGGGYSSSYGSYSNHFGTYNNFGGGYGMGGFPRQGSYGGGAWPIGGSYGGGAYPRGGSYGGGGISLYIGR